MARRSPAGVLPTLAIAIAVACLLGSACRYHARLGDSVEGSCRANCAEIHSSCVAGGEAAKLGLPGITYHLCARDLEACRENCSRAKRARLPDEALATESARPAPMPAEGVTWDPAESRLRCTRASHSVSLPRGLAATIARAGPDEILVDLAPDAILLRAQQGPPAEVLEAWARLQARLSGDGELQVDLRGAQTSSAGGVERWDVGYEVDGARLRASMRRVRRQGASCTVLAIEREGLASGRSLRAALESFDPPALAP